MRWTEFAVREARRTLTDWEQKNGKLFPPIAVEDIADLLYFLAIDTTDNLPANIAGKLYTEDRVIEVKKSDAYVRQRFTIAHEIGHYQLHVVATGLLPQIHSCNDQIISSSDEQEPILLPGFETPITKSQTVTQVDARRFEIEANRFAAELLMPVALIEAAIDTYGTDVSALAELFVVSLPAMQFRLEKLLYLPPSGPQTSFLTGL